MPIDITTPALFFPAMSLLLVAYTNRFLAVARVIRDLSERRGVGTVAAAQNIEFQIDILRKQILLIRGMKGCALLGLIACVVCMFFLFFGYEPAGRWAFAVAHGLNGAIAAYFVP